MTLPGICMFYTQADWRILVSVINSVTGWDMTVEEAKQFGYRMVSLMRCLNMRNGIRAYDYGVSKRWMSLPTEGEWKQPAVVTEEVQKKMFDGIAAGLGWDVETACPTAETLRKLGLDDVVPVMAAIDFTTTNEAVRKA